MSGEEDEAPVEGDTDRIFEGVAGKLELGGGLGIALLEAAEADSLVDDAVADSSDALEDEGTEVASVDVIVTESEVVVAGIVENVVNESEDGARDVDGSESDEEVVASEDDTDGDDDAGGSSSVGVAVLDSEPLMSSQRQTPKDGGKKRHALDDSDDDQRDPNTLPCQRRRAAWPPTGSLAISS